MANTAYREWKRKLVLKARDKRVPIQAQFELTPRCNLDCKMCYVHNQNSNAMKDLELTTEQWKRIFDEAYDMGLLFATVTGGECLLRSDFKELYLHLWNKGVRVDVLTNGTMLNDDYVAFFKEHQPEFIQISLYGSSEDGYRHVTGHTGFEKANAAITKLMECGIEVRVTVTPSKYMLEDYVPTVAYAHKAGYQLALSDMNQLPNRDDAEKNDYYLTAEELYKLYEGRAKVLAELVPVEEIPAVGGTGDYEGEKGLNCTAGNSLAVVTWEGKMYPCNSIMLGGASLREMSYAEAWEITKNAVDDIYFRGECKGCPYEKTCPKCPAARLENLYTGRCNPAVCQMTQKLVAAGIKKLMPTE